MFWSRRGCDCLFKHVGRSGITKKNILLLDSKGVINSNRSGLDESKKKYARDTPLSSLSEALEGADIFLGCSAAGVLKPEMLLTMAPSPIILALANPEPEIRPELAKKTRPDCIIATGRSDYPNQVNNVLCFPFIFRGTLDVGATAINEEMKHAAVKAIASLARDTNQSVELKRAYGGVSFTFGPDFIIPKPFDPRLISTVAPAVAQAAIASGVATRTLDIDEYRKKLQASVYRTGMVMYSQFELARTKNARIAFAEGCDERVISAMQYLIAEKLAFPILIGQREYVIDSLKNAGVKFVIDKDFEVFDVKTDSRNKVLFDLWGQKKQLLDLSPELILHDIVSDTTLQGSLLVAAGYADGLISGLEGTYQQHLRPVSAVFGNQPGFSTYAAMNLLLLDKQQIFVCDTYVNENPTAKQLADMAVLSARQVQSLGIEPSVAFVSHSNYGDIECESHERMKEALQFLRKHAPELKVDGPMHADSALCEDIRSKSNQHSPLKGAANILIMPNMDAANITYNILKMTGSAGVTLGPFLLGSNASVHILTPAATVRRVINMAVISAASV